MTVIKQAPLPRDMRGNDPNDHRADTGYLEKLEAESTDVGGPLAWIGDFVVSLSEAAAMADPEFIEPGLIVRGQLHVICAAPNAGKTTIFFHLAGRMAAGGHTVVYVNADVSGGDAKHYVERAATDGINLLLPDMKAGKSMRDVVERLEQLNENGADLSGNVFIFDTLKKMCDVINKRAAKQLLVTLRSLTAKGATIILLAHTNKYTQDDGKPIFEGTGDIRSDVDNLLYLIADKQADGSLLVAVEPDKQRAALERMTFKISPAREVTRLPNFADVARLRADRAQREQDEDAIERITAAIEAGATKQADLVLYCKDYGLSRRRVLAVLKRYSVGTSPLWKQTRGFQRNAVFYELSA